MSATPDADLPVSSNWQQRFDDLLPLILPIAVVFTFFAFYSWFLSCAPHQSCSPFTSAEILANVSTADQTRVSAYIARGSWTLINGVHLLACLAAIITACVVINRALSKCDASVRWMIIVITVFAALDMALGASLWTLEDVLSPAQLLHQATIGKVLPSINKYNRFAEALSLTSALSLGAAACAILWQSHVNKTPDGAADPDAVADFKERIDMLNKPVLYFAAAVLVLGVIRLSATHAWAISYFPPDKDIGKELASLTTGIVGLLGTTYTLVIAGIYVPAVLILRSRLNKVAPGEVPSTGLMQLIPKIMAIIGPFLAGPLGKLLIDLANSLGGKL